MRSALSQGQSPNSFRALPVFVLGAWTSISALACSGGANASGEPQADAGSSNVAPTPAGSAADPTVDASPPGGKKRGGNGGTQGSAADSGAPSSLGDAGVGATSSDAGYPAGWLYTSGGKIYVSNGSAAGAPWMGRGANMDDIFMCGYDGTLWMTSPAQDLETIASGLVSGWKANFVRISLAMDSYPTVSSWISSPAQYKTPMTNVINAIGARPGVHVLVTLRSDASMIGQDMTDGDPEATGLPSDAASTPNAASYPTGTDATYIALVDTFAMSSFVMFGVTNEPGGNKLSNEEIAAAMAHAVGVIRGEEDRLGAPHHIVSVQGNAWTSDISFYSSMPIAYDNVVYEIHGYPPPASSYTYSNIPVIIGEYGSLTSATSASFYADLEAKQIPNLAWDFDPYNDCSPDLLNVTASASSLTPSSWGSIVQAYLSAHSSP